MVAFISDVDIPWLNEEEWFPKFERVFHRLDMIRALLRSGHHSIVTSAFFCVRPHAGRTLVGASSTAS